MLSLQPDSFVLAVGMKGKPATAVVTVSNTTSDTVAYKIKANYPDVVCIDNPRKAISPLSCVDVSISVESAECDLKLKIVSAVLPASGSLSWKQAYRQVLSVRVLSVSAQTLTLPGVKLQGNLTDTQAKVMELQVSTAGLISEVETMHQLVKEKKGKRGAASGKTDFSHYFLSFVAGLVIAYVLSCFTSSII